MQTNSCHQTSRLRQLKIQPNGVYRMINIDELRQRVSDAERRFGLIDERQKAYSARLGGMIEAVDSRQHDSDAKLRETEAALRQAKDDNEQLRSLLHQLLTTIDSAGRDHLKTPIGELTQRLEATTAAPPPTPQNREDSAVSDSASAAPAPAAEDDVPKSIEALLIGDTAVAAGATAPTAQNVAADSSASVRDILRRMNENIGDGAGKAG